MNTTQTLSRRQPQPLLSAGARIAAALAVVACVSAAWTGTEHESREAVQLSAAAMAPRPIYVTLQPVEIVARRERAPETALASAHAAHHAL